MRILSLSYQLNGLFKQYGDVYNDDTILHGNNVDLVVFPGGPDVPPGFYGEKMHPQTYTSHQHYQRFEDVYKIAAAQGCTFVGICGGAQYLCVKAGGSLIQHVENHAKRGTHGIQSVLGPADVTSTHHQMMRPYGTKHQLLAWADGLSPIHQDGNEDEVLLIDNKEPEAVWFEENNALAVQWHPEYMSEGQSGYRLFQSLIQKYVI